MNIRQRIILFIALAGAALCFIGFFAVQRADGSAREVRSVTEGVVPSAIHSVELINQLKDVQIAAMSMLSADSPEVIETSLKELTAKKAALQSALDGQLGQATNQAQRGLVVQAQESLVNYFQSIDETAGFIKKGQRVMAEANMAATVDQYLREQGEVMQTLQVEKTRSKDEAIDTVNRNLTGTTATLAGVTLVSVLILGTLGLVLYRRVVHPLGEMQLTMTSIATTQDFNHRLEVTREDEIGKSMRAFNTMIERIQESSELVRQKSADIHAMLHYIPQGIMTLEPGGRIHPEFSDHLKAVLERDDLAGQDVMSVVFGGTNLGVDARSQIETAISACIGEDEMNFEFNAHLLPLEIERDFGEGRSKVLDLNWSPITDESGTTLRLLLCVRDVTELRALARAAESQKRELAIIGEILGVSQEKFSTFIDGSRQFMDDNAELLARPGDVQPDGRLALLFRNMHTVKGNARTHGLLTLTNVLHSTEQTYDDLRHGRLEWDGERLQHELSAARQALEEYATISQDKLGRKGPGRRGGTESFLMVPQDQMQGLLGRLEQVDQGNPAEMAEVLAQACSQLRQLGTARLKTLISPALEALPSLAEELGKEPPHLQLVDNGIALRSSLAGMLGNVFMHLLRNSIDHGIETAQERVALGKPAAGTIGLTLDLAPEGLRLVLRDDGRGLALARIRERAVQQGLIAESDALEPADIARLVFASGFSTAQQVTEVSGRGVGMDAVKGFVEAEGGTIELLLSETAQSGAAYGPFETVITLPSKLGVRVDT